MKPSKQIKTAKVVKRFDTIGRVGWWVVFQIDLIVDGKTKPFTYVDRKYATEARANKELAKLIATFHEQPVEDKKTPSSLAAAARAAGYEPETVEGGRAMMQALTPEHLHQAETTRRLRTLKPGDEIEYTNFTVGGSHKGKAVVTWDHGKSVEARTLPAGEKVRLERANDGSLRRFT